MNLQGSDSTFTTTNHAIVFNHYKVKIQLKDIFNSVNVTFARHYFSAYICLGAF